MLTTTPIAIPHHSSRLSAADTETLTSSFAQLLFQSYNRKSPEQENIDLYSTSCIKKTYNTLTLHCGSAGVKVFFRDSGSVHVSIRKKV